MSRELKSNGGRARYRGTCAHHGAYVRARRPQTPNLVAGTLAATVETWLEQRWSPQAICRRFHGAGERPALSHPEVLIALRRARDLTDRDFAQPLTLDSMAQAAHLSKFHFARAFTKAYGETPRTYLTRRRIERAKDLLRAANLTITEICFLVGFESVGSFSSRFRDLVGMSPTEYRSASASAPPIPGCFVLMWTRPGLARSQQSGRSTVDGRPVASGP